VRPAWVIDASRSRHEEATCRVRVAGQRCDDLERVLRGAVAARRQGSAGSRENWDGASNGVHPGLGWIPSNDGRLAQHGYNVINAVFPVIRSDGTVLWENGMDAGVKVSTPAEMRAAKAAGAALVVQGATVRVPYDKQVRACPARVGAGCGHAAGVPAVC